MTEEQPQRRPSIATIFNPKKQKNLGSTQGPSRPRPSVVVTDEDTPRGTSFQLTNGGDSFRINVSPRSSFAAGRSASFNLSSLSTTHQDHDAGNQLVILRRKISNPITRGLMIDLDTRTE